MTIFNIRYLWCCTRGGEGAGTQVIADLRVDSQRWFENDCRFNDCKTKGRKKTAKMVDAALFLLEEK